MAEDVPLHSYYERDRERDRLASGLGRVEFERTTEIIMRTLPQAPAVVADVGGGPGRYTDWLAEQGYAVKHSDIVPHHVDQVLERYRSDGAGDSGAANSVVVDSVVVDSVVGDACRLDLGDGSVDAVLLLGPLYHLAEPADRAQAIGEAMRVTRPGGMIYAATIGRWAARLSGALVDPLYHEHPHVLDSFADVESSGVLPPIFEGAFSGYTHTPDELRTEMTIKGLALEGILAVEGPASMLADDLIDERLANELDCTVLFESLGATEAVPELMGVSAHLLAIARRV